MTPRDITETEDQRPRRFLIATAVTHHATCAGWDRPGLEGARTDIVSLLANRFGYTVVETPGMNPTAAQLLDGLARFCRAPERRADDIVAVYFTGHGERLLHTDEHVLITADTDPAFLADAPTTEAIARKILFGTPVRRLLLMLDTCYSGKGGADFAAAALTRYTHHWSEDDTGAGIVVISSAQPRQLAETGEFPRLLTAAVDSLSTAGHKPSTLSVQAVVTAMNRLAPAPGWQRIGLEKVRLTGDTPPFLPNPRHRHGSDGPQAWLQSSVEEDFARRRDIEFRTRLLVRAMGNQDNKGWWFTGRHTALTDINTWLTNPDTHDNLLVVTGDPGSGKTAVLGVIAALTDPDYHHSVPRTTLGLPAEAAPPVGVVDVVIYAQNLTTEHIRDRIATAAHLNTDTPEHLGTQLSTRTQPLTVLIDALDEAGDPHQLITKLLRPLLHHAGAGLRVLTGTRPYLLENLGTDRQNSVDLDADRYADPEALTAYAVRGLIDATPDSIYLTQPPTVIRAVADVIAERAERCFLVARIVAATLSATPTLPDPTDPDWRRGLPRLPGDAMREDLETRLGPDAAKARALLLPLAFAQGQGLPWEDLWAGLASALAAIEYTDADLIWLRRSAGSYVVEATEAGRSVYRLYHQALADHLTENIDARSVQAQFVEVLCRRVPTGTDGRRDWARAHPYTLAHLATHATHAGLVDELVTDIGYLVYAEPGSLLAALHEVRSDEALLARAVYRWSADRHRHRSPVQRRQLLAIDAARFGATDQQHTLNCGLEWPVLWATGNHVHRALQNTITVTKDSLALACISVDGRSLAVTGGEDGAVRVWDLTTGSERTVFTGHTSAVFAVACTSIDSRPVAVTGGEDRTVRIWDLATGTERATLIGHTSPVFSVACTSIDSRLVAVTVSSDHTVRVWDLTTGTERTVLTAVSYWACAVACISIDGLPVAVTGGDGGMVLVWDLAFGIERATLRGHRYRSGAVACTSIDGRPVAVTGGQDGTVRLWDLTMKTERAVLTGHTDEVRVVACASIDGRPVAVTGGGDGTVLVWDLTTGTQRAVLTVHSDNMRTVACTNIDDRPYAVTGGSDGTVRVWDLCAPSPLTSTASLSASVLVDAGTGIGPVAVIGSSDGTVKVSNLATGTEHVVLTGHTGPVYAVACTRIQDRPVAVTGSWDNTVRVWDLTTGTQHAKLTGHTNPVHAVACTRIQDRPVAVTGSWDNTVRVWDLTTGTQHAVLTGHTHWVRTVACTSIEDNPVAVTSGEDATVRVWDLTTGTKRAVLTGHTDKVRVLACTSIDGRAVAVAASDDSTVRVWDLATGTKRAVLTGHTDKVRALACTSIEGRPVAVTGGADHTVRIWDLLAERVVAVIDSPAVPDFLVAATSREELIIGLAGDIAVLSLQSTPPRWIHT
ncbi:caspase family protein [Nocardia takedensis]